jgi:hypothetical protein
MSGTNKNSISLPNSSVEMDNELENECQAIMGSGGSSLNNEQMVRLIVQSNIRREQRMMNYIGSLFSGLAGKSSSTLAETSDVNYATPSKSLTPLKMQDLKKMFETDFRETLIKVATKFIATYGHSKDAPNYEGTVTEYTKEILDNMDSEKRTLLFGGDNKEVQVSCLRSRIKKAISRKFSHFAGKLKESDYLPALQNTLQFEFNMKANEVTEDRLFSEMTLYVEKLILKSTDALIKTSESASFRKSLLNYGLNVWKQRNELEWGPVESKWTDSCESSSKKGKETVAVDGKGNEVEATVAEYESENEVYGTAISQSSCREGGKRKHE